MASAVSSVYQHFVIIRKFKLGEGGRKSLLSKQIITNILIALLFLTICFSAKAQDNTLKISTAEDIKSDFDSVPCQNDARFAAVKALFERAGALESDISLDKYKGVENLVIRKPGTTEETLVIGAHYDKVPAGCGAVDNWTGIVALSRLFATLKDVKLRKTILFVAFGKEEMGLVGSQAMVNAIPKDKLAQYCVMINIDSLGLSVPQALDNASSKKLRELAAELAAQLKIPFNHASIANADADSSSFVRKKIPALTIHGLNNDWPSILHSSKDQSSKVSPLGVYLGYRLVLALISRLNDSGCDLYR